MGNSGTGISIGTGLTLIFAAAKVFGFINWSWWWVLAPFLISTAIGLVILAIVLLVVIIAAINS